MIRDEAGFCVVQVSYYLLSAHWYRLHAGGWGNKMKLQPSEGHRHVYVMWWVKGMGSVYTRQSAQPGIRSHPKEAGFYLMGNG